jgi:ATP-dependent DNA helicase
LEELQAAMTDDAQRAADKAEKKSKKRKGEGKGRGSKKTKKDNGDSADALQSAQLKDANIRKEGKKIIFTQPPNLSKGCVLKDYQLEGVRWLASLFENGVSGILADEVSTAVALSAV